MTPALDVGNNLFLLITLYYPSELIQSQIKMGNLKFATMFPEQANSCLTLAGGDKDSERLAAIGSVWTIYLFK